MQAPRKESQPARAERVLFLPRVCLKFRFVDPLHRARSREETSSSSRDIRPYSETARNAGLRGGRGLPPRLLGIFNDPRTNAREGARGVTARSELRTTLSRFPPPLFLHFFFSFSFSFFRWEEEGNGGWREHALTSADRYADEEG